MNNNKKVLVTGADGFIGSHLTEKLLDLGHEVRAFVLYNSFNSKGWLNNIQIKTFVRLCAKIAPLLMSSKI